MSYTYDPSAPTTRDMLRLLLRDTTSPGLWANEELDALLANSRTLTEAWRLAVAAEAARLATAAARSLSILTQSADFASRALDAIDKATPDRYTSPAQPSEPSDF